MRHSRRWQAIGIGVLTALILSVAAWILLVLRWPESGGTALPRVEATAELIVVAERLPAYLHYDVDEEGVSGLTVGDVPLSYGYLLDNPGSGYARVISRLTALADRERGAFVVNFRPAELPDGEVAMMAGAVCVSAQSEKLFPAYHQAAVAAGTKWNLDQVVAAGTAAGADGGRLRTCVDGAVPSGKLTEKWLPAELSRDDLMSRMFADGESISEDTLSCGADDPRAMGIEDTLTCIERSLAMARTSPQDAAEAVAVIPSLSGGRLVMIVRRTSEFAKLRQYHLEAYSSPTESVRLGPLDIRTYTGQARIIGNDLYLVVRQPLALRRVSLLNGTQKLLVLASGSPADSSESLSYFTLIGEKLYYFTRRADSPDYQPEGWKLRVYDLRTCEVKSLATTEKFELYSVPSSIDRDERTGRLTVTVAGGDGGVAFRTYYAVDESGQRLELVDREVINFACADAKAPNEWCSAEDIRVVSKYMVDEQSSAASRQGCYDGACHCGVLKVPLVAREDEFIGCWMAK